MQTLFNQIHTFKPLINTVLLVLVFAFKIHGQEMPPPAGFVEVKLDILNQQVKDGARVPFGVPLLLTAETDKLKSALISQQGLKVEMYLMDGICASLTETDITRYDHTAITKSTWSYYPSKIVDGNPRFVWTESFPLAPNYDYCLLFAKRDPDGAGGSGSLGPIISRINLRPRASLSDHIKSDFGIGYVPKIKGIIGLLSVHFYFTAVNNDTNLGYGSLPTVRQVFSRLSLFVGLAPLLFSSETEQEIKNLTKLGNLVYGIGIRSPFYYPPRKSFGRLVLQPMRLNVGFIRFIQDDANPLIVDNRYKTAPFVSITYDFNLSQLLGPIGKLFQ